MMQSAQDSVGNYDTAALDWPVAWGIFLQAEMGSGRVTIKCICDQNAPKMRLAPDNDVVETFPPDRADYPLNVTVLPG